MPADTSIPQTSIKACMFMFEKLKPASSIRQWVGKGLRNLLTTASVGIAVSGLAQSQPANGKAILKVETGVHVGGIDQAVFSMDGRTLVTSSSDKTARVWDTQLGRLLGVLRTPIGVRGDGRHRALAVHPNGQIIALAVNAHPSIHLFSRDQRLLRTVPGAGVHAMRFREDGVLIVAERDRLAAIDTSTGERRELAPLEVDKFEVGGGRLLAVVGKLTDGQELKLCEAAGAGPCRTIHTALAGHVFHRLSMSPDGNRIWAGTRHFLSGVPRAVDYQTLLLDARSGAQISASSRSSGRWVWGLDGRGLEVSDDGKQVREIAADGQLGQPWAGHSIATGPRYDVAHRSERAAMAFAQGRLFFVGHRPQEATTAVFRTAPENISVSTALDLTGPALFARPVLEGKYSTPSTESLAFFPLPQGSSCMFSGARHEPMTPEQVAKITDACPNVRRLPDGGALVTGNGKATRFEADGRIKWSSRTSSVDPSVRILFTMDGRLFALPGEDGMLRYHALAHGRELLSVYRNGDRWVEATESGLYRASVGAEQILGWHVNGGEAAVPDFFPLSQFRARFNRPDVIDRILDTLDETEAIKQADQAANRKTEPALAVAQVLPPVVELLSAPELRSSGSEVSVRVRARSAADAPVTAWRVRVNGQPVLDLRGDWPSSANPAGTAPPLVGANANADPRELTVPVPAQDSTVQVFAENRHGTSVPADVRVVRTPAPSTSTAPAPAAPGFAIQPKLYVLAVGVADYQHPNVSKLQLAAKDARDFVAALQRQRGRLYRDVEVKLLTDADATADAVIDGLEWLRRQVTQHDVGMVFVAGHGVNDPELGYAFLPANADPDRLRRTSVPMEEFRRTLSRLPGKALFFFDTCHSGNVLGSGARAAFNDVSRVVNELASAENGVVVFSSSTGRQLSYEDPAWGNGAFTLALVEGLDGRADYQRNGRITHKMLDLWISERVKQLTKGKQSPVTQAPGGVPDFPVALVR